MIDPTRVQVLSDKPVRAGAGAGGKYVLYWMQASQRTRFNHALEYAIARANASKLPVVVCFGLTDDYPEANARHYLFMLQGLRDVETGLRERRIAFEIRRGEPPQVALNLSRQAALVVCDRGYLRHQKQWRDVVADGARCQVVEVESDVVVPVEVASDKPEFAARTLRPKIHRHLEHYLEPLHAQRVVRPSLELGLKSDVDVSDPDAALAKLKVDHGVAPTSHFTGGERAAEARLGW